MEELFNTTELIVFPDIHGRDFWKDPVMQYKDDLTKGFIFLGDYFDPYSQDGVSEANAIENWEALCDAVNTRPNTHWGIGNHDFHYLPKFAREWGCRRSYQYYDYIQNVFLSNYDKFNIAYEYVTDNGKRLLFTHAGVTYAWARDIKYFIEKNNYEDIKVDSVFDVYNVDFLNSLKSDPKYYWLLWLCGYDRGGNDMNGSCLWADFYSMCDDEAYFKFMKSEGQERIKDIYQVVGHSYSTGYAIKDRFAMLDCKKAFIIDCKTGDIKPYDYN